jgi:hypothetical protein
MGGSRSDPDTQSTGLGQPTARDSNSLLVMRQPKRVGYRRAARCRARRTVARPLPAANRVDVLRDGASRNRSSKARVVLPAPDASGHGPLRKPGPSAPRPRSPDTESGAYRSLACRQARLRVPLRIVPVSPRRQRNEHVDLLCIQRRRGSSSAVGPVQSTGCPEQAGKQRQRQRVGRKIARRMASDRRFRGAEGRRVSRVVAARSRLPRTPLAGWGRSLPIMPSTTLVKVLVGAFLAVDHGCTCAARLLDRGSGRQSLSGAPKQARPRHDPPRRDLGWCLPVRQPAGSPAEHLMRSAVLADRDSVSDRLRTKSGKKVIKNIDIAHV